ncbi:DUF4249 domain-containing protein [Dysgonomonas sp. 521]|uniref:DUF4249 domain-containing protein n=1 Tax=Dysgonomonas sp. 521 TaxID=2302932 RepID=UPI0013D54F7D|nr:DUF4249 domain-containing protein [Dysgonomonas sp. 521]NDV97177.1 DUF4249 domain-containing protein [Dysgonomonas sp. 521]
MKPYIAIVAFILIIVVSSCQYEREVDIDIITIKPQLVLNSLLFAERDSTYFYLTKSRSAFKDSNTFWRWEDSEFEYVEDADMQMTLNGESFQLKYSKVDSAYIFPDRLNANDNIELKVNQKDGELKAKTTLPAPPSIISVDTAKVYKSFGETKGNFLQFKIKMKDYPIETNYYRLLVDIGITLYSWSGWHNWYDSFYTSQYYTNDPILTNGMPPNIISNFDIVKFPENYLSIFPDKLFENDEYTLTFYIDYSYITLGDERDKGYVTVKIQSITEDLYNYYFSVQRNDYISSGGYNEPVVIYNNIEGGLGILGACNEATVFHLEK